MKRFEQIEDALTAISKIALSGVPEKSGFIFYANEVRAVLRDLAGTPGDEPLFSERYNPFTMVNALRDLLYFYDKVRGFAGHGEGWTAAEVLRLEQIRKLIAQVKPVKPEPLHCTCSAGLGGKHSRWCMMMGKHRLDINGQCVDCGADSSLKLSLPCRAHSRQLQAHSHANGSGKPPKPRKAPKSRPRRS